MIRTRIHNCSSIMRITPRAIYIIRVPNRIICIGIVIIIFI